MPKPAAILAGAMLVAGLAACGDGPATAPALAGEPRDIVISRGDVVQVLPDIAASAYDTGGDGTAELRVVRQLDAHTVLAIADGDLVALDPADPGQPRTVAPAIDWFPAHDGRNLVWVVTGAPVQPGCEVRYHLEQRALDSDVRLHARELPCGMQPKGDTAAGLLVNTSTDVQVVDRDSLAPVRTVLTTASLVQAAGDTILASRGGCRTGACTEVRSLSGAAVKLGELPGGGWLTSTAVFDRSGRRLAAVSVAQDGTLHLVACDLVEGTVLDLGSYATSGLDDDMPAVWSGDRLLVADSQRSRLMAYESANGRVGIVHLPTTGSLQVWGAAG